MGVQRLPIGHFSHYIKGLQGYLRSWGREAAATD